MPSKTRYVASRIDNTPLAIKGLAKIAPPATKVRNQHVIMSMSVSLVSWRGDRQTFGESWPVYAGQVFNQLNLQFRHLT